MNTSECGMIILSYYVRVTQLTSHLIVLKNSLSYSIDDKTCHLKRDVASTYHTKGGKTLSLYLINCIDTSFTVMDHTMALSL